MVSKSCLNGLETGLRLVRSEIGHRLSPEFLEISGPI